MQSAARSRDKRIMQDAVGSTESLASAGQGTASSWRNSVELRQDPNLPNMIIPKIESEKKMWHSPSQNPIIIMVAILEFWAKHLSRKIRFAPSS